jgi:hypothetical protein
MTLSAVAARASKHSWSTLIVQAKDWQLWIVYELEGNHVPIPDTDDLAEVKLPFNMTPEQTPSIPDKYTVGVQHYTSTNDPDSVPWTSYYANYHGACLAVANTFGVWFEIEKTNTGWKATRLVRYSIPVKHWLIEGIDMDCLEKTGSTVQPPLVEPHKKQPVFCSRINIDTMDTESKVEEDENIKPSRSSQTKHSQGKKPRYSWGMGNNPYMTNNLDDSDDEKLKHLEGKLPKDFNGDRNNMHTFLQDFGSFMNMNIGTDIERHPFKKSTYFLSLIQGPDTEGWADNIHKWLKEARKDW